MQTAEKKLPPMMPGGVPVLGHALELNRRPVDLLMRGRRTLGDVFSIALPGTPRTVVMTGPKAQEKFFRLGEPDVSLRDVYRLMTPIFGKGIAYDAEPEIMAEQLGFFHAALRESHLRKYTDGFVAEAEEFFGRWGDDAVVDLYQTGNELTIYTSSRVFLGLEFRRKLSEEFSKLYFDMEGGLSLLAFFAPHLPTPKFLKRDRARKRMGELIANIVEDRRRHGKQDADFLQALMEARYESGRALTHDEITGLILAIMFAGHHTSGVTFSWTSVLLAKHPDWRAELVREQERVLGDRTEVTLEDLNAMEKLGWTIKEVLRLYPPLIMLMRKVLTPFEVMGFDVPQNAMIMASPAVSHRIPELFPNPDTFDPERFGPERAEDKKNPMSFIAFGGGRHKCMGTVFAQLQLKAIYSQILRNFDLTLYGDVYEPDYDRMLVGPRLPCRARFVRKKRRAVLAA
jgi:sterol 14-demethylase